jgi:hypothetical protein
MPFFNITYHVSPTNMNHAQIPDSSSSSANIPRTLINAAGLTSSLYPSPMVGRAFNQEVVARRDSYVAVLISTIICICL